MMDRLLGRLIEFSMRRSGRVIFAFIVLSLLGAWAAWRSPLDAIPDLSDPQVLLYAHVPGSPEQIAQTVTAPMMQRLRTVPGVRTVRGFSDLGYSYVTALVDDGADLGRVRLAIEGETHKDAAQAWQVASDASGVGWVYQYALASPDGGQDLYQLRSLQEEVLGPALAALPGVAEVAPVGGYSRRFEVVANPRLLEAQGVKPWQMTQALTQAAGPMRGRMLMLGERDVILGFSSGPAKGPAGASEQALSVESASDLEALPVKVQGKLRRLGDLARVRQAPDLRRGIADLNGEGEVVGGIVIARKGVNALELIRRVEAKLEGLKKGLPAGVQVVPVYDRSSLILSSLRTVRRELIQELLLVALVVVLFLGHWRSVLVLSIALPVTIFLHFIPLHLAGLSMNLMTLGGLAIAIGDILDAGIILVENGNRALADAQGGGEERRLAALKDSAVLLIRPLFFTLLIVVVSFLPVFALEGQEGRLFLPLAASKSLSMLSALAVTVILIPALCARYLRGRFLREEEQPLMARLQAWYRPSLAWVLERPWTSLAVNFSVLALTVPLLLALPREFLPPLNEGSLLYMPVTAAGVPAAQAGAMLKEVDRRLMEVPEVDRVFGKAGRAESATDPAPLSMIESTVLLKPRSTWRKGMDEAGLVKEMDAKLSFVGLSNGWTQPIRGRIDMQSTGVRTPLGIKVFAPTLEAAERAAVALEHAAAGLPGLRSAAAERAARAPLLSVAVDLSAAAKAGLTADEVLGQVLAHAGGSALAQAKGVPVAVVYPEDFTDSLSKMQAFPIFTPKGVLPLGRLARVELRLGPDMVAMENGQPSATVYLDLKDRDVMGWVRQQRAKLPPASALGAGVRWQFSGQYEADQRARQRLLWLLPLCLALIAGMLALAFGSMGEAALVMLSVPFALIGGVWIQALLAIPLSVSVWVGYIALFAVAVQTGVVMVVYLQEALNRRLAVGAVDGEGLKAVVMEGAVLRLRPKLMTVATNVIGFVPMLWTKGPGDDLLASVAAPLVGGMLSSAVHVLYITPVLFLLTQRRRLARGTLKAKSKRDLL
jgi:Cu(I)/Ag(I) efflux system membrane protein CusA/SilA